MYPSRHVARATVADYMDHFYNPQRRHSYLGYVSRHRVRIESTNPRFCGIVKLSTPAGEDHPTPPNSRILQRDVFFPQWIF
jgi:hypothetical protein